MRAVITRVSRASITVNGTPGGSMERGFLVLLGIKAGDTAEQCDYLVKKCAELRIFEDEDGKMNKSLEDIGAGMMVVSNFTLYAQCAKGRRPDFLSAAKPDEAIPLYERFLSGISQRNLPLITGEFGADMQIDHVNDGPVTIIMDTEQMMKK